MLEIIWGLKTHAIFDVWTIEHFLSGISVGFAVKKTNHNVFATILNLKDHSFHSWHFDLTGILCLAYAWETFEHYLETGWGGAL